MAKQTAGDQSGETGFHAFLADVKTELVKAQLADAQLADDNTAARSTRQFILQSAERYAHICLQDARKSPRRFLRQMAGKPPVCFGTAGFARELVDDEEPARHYTAFVFVGYWLPSLLAVPLLWAWEILGFFRYGSWSQPDIRSGYVGIRHGRLIRRQGAGVWPELIQRDLRLKS